MCICMYLYMCICVCIYIHIQIYAWIVHPCQVRSCFWASAQTYDCLCQGCIPLFHVMLFFRSLYILCTTWRILAYWLMFLVLHTTRNKAYLILSYIWLKHKKTQMEINTYKILPFFKISRTHAWKVIPFFYFAYSRLPLKKYPPFREKWVQAWHTLWSGEGVGVGWGDH